MKRLVKGADERALQQAHGQNANNLAEMESLQSYHHTIPEPNARPASTPYYPWYNS